MLFLEAVSEEVHQCVVEVISAEVCITVGSEYFEYAVTKLEYGYIECTAAKVVNEDLLASVVLVKSVCKGCSCRLVDDSLNIKSCNLSCVLGCLLLSI